MRLIHPHTPTTCVSNDDDRSPNHIMRGGDEGSKESCGNGPPVQGAARLCPAATMAARSMGYLPRSITSPRTHLEEDSVAGDGQVRRRTRVLLVRDPRAPPALRARESPQGMRGRVAGVHAQQGASPPRIRVDLVDGSRLPGAGCSTMCRIIIGAGWRGQSRKEGPSRDAVRGRQVDENRQVQRRRQLPCALRACDDRRKPSTPAMGRTLSNPQVAEAALEFEQRK